MKITVSVDVPEGESCFEQDYHCSFLLHFSEHCRLFDEMTPEATKCPACLEACRMADQTNHTLSEISEVKAMLAETPPESAIDRASLEGRLKVLNERVMGTGENKPATD